MEQEDFDKLKKELQEYADKSGIHFNPNEKVVDGIIKSLLTRKEKMGDAYCPCRVPTGNVEKDKEIVCPCVFNRGEIGLQDHCHCNLFVK